MFKKHNLFIHLALKAIISNIDNWKLLQLLKISIQTCNILKRYKKQFVKYTVIIKIYITKIYE